MEHQGAAPIPPVEFKDLTKSACGARFNCGATEINRYLKRDAWRLHSRHSHRVTYAHLSDDALPAGFLTLATVTEEVGKLKGTFFHRFGGADRFPCLQLVWLGVSLDHQGKKIGTRLVGKAIETFAEVGAKVGLPQLILVPISDEVKPFYQRLGFTEYDEGRRMFLPLRTAIEAAGI